MAGGMKKNLRDYIPILEDQGIQNLVGTPDPGVSIQSLTWVMSSTGIVVFATEGLADMADTSYQVFVTNQTDLTDPGTVTNANKGTLSMTITGPDQNDVLDVLIVGTTKGQLK